MHDLLWSLLTSYFCDLMGKRSNLMFNLSQYTAMQKCKKKTASTKNKHFVMKMILFLCHVKSTSSLPRKEVK